jgi:uncharacterized glyoxalase superfamily protein PhnB
MQTTETRIMIYTSKYFELLQFYKEVLGFREKVLFETGIMLDSGSSIVELFDRPDLSKTQIKLSFEVENSLVFWDKIKDKVHISHELRFNPWGDTSFGVFDPDGNELIFFTKSKLI